jgi:polyisoprenoid-binding protein YceI
VAGELFVDFSNPSASRIGAIRINARTLITDNEFRNRAIRSEILESSKDEYEFIDFTPTAITGLPASVTVGEAITFQVTGDLKIRDIVQSVTFDVTLTAVSEERLEGSATATVTRTQFNLQIPSVPSVANVTDEVGLAINFVALKAG